MVVHNGANLSHRMKPQPCPYPPERVRTDRILSGGGKKIQFQSRLLPEGLKSVNFRHEIITVAKKEISIAGSTNKVWFHWEAATCAFPIYMAISHLALFKRNLHSCYEMCWGCLMIHLTTNGFLFRPFVDYSQNNWSDRLHEIPVHIYYTMVNLQQN